MHVSAIVREFSLSLHPEKTRLIEFGRFAVERVGRTSLPGSGEKSSLNQAALGALSAAFLVYDRARFADDRRGS
jgi:hypothetical protein